VPLTQTIPLIKPTTTPSLVTSRNSHGDSTTVTAASTPTFATPSLGYRPTTTPGSV